MSPRIYISLSPNGVERVTVGAQGPESRDEALETLRSPHGFDLGFNRAARNAGNAKNADGTWIPRSAFL